MSSETELLGHFIKKVQSRHHKMLDRNLQALSISLVQWNALRAINDQPGVSSHALAELTFNSDQAFGTLSTRLVRLGFVKRKPGKGRAIVHTLTSKGLQMLKDGRKIMLVTLEQSFEPLGAEERTELLRMMVKLLRVHL